MLGMHGVRREGADYYLSDPARELPEPVPARWVGGAASGLGLEGPLAPADFVRLLQGRHPHTGHPIGTGRAAVGAYDLTFSAPKSVSVLFALGGRDTAAEIVAAHEQAVAGALWYLERHGVTATRQEGSERTVLPTTGMVAGRFTHAVNRNGDPHLHSHVVMANLVHGTDGRWSACDRRGLDAHRRAGGAVYAAHLRHALSGDLGLRWSAAPDRLPEIAGISPALLGEFSSRAADIRAAGRGRRVAWALTRSAKEPSSPYDDLVQAWRRRAEGVGWAEPGRLDPPGGSDRGTPAVLDEHRVAGAISLTPHNGARRRDVVAAMAAGASDGAGATTLERLVDTWVPPGPPGVAEPLQARRDVLPANHHLRALGPRPVDAGDHALWTETARALDAYRARWGLERSPEPLGSGSLTSLSPARLADRVRMERRLDLARARLGLRQPQALELDLGR